MIESHSFYRRIIPEQVKTYLAINGWIEDGIIGNIATIWHRLEDKATTFEILLPEYTTIRDYFDRINDAFIVLAEYEQRNIYKIVEDISHLFADTVKVRVIHDDVENGTIPLEDGALLIDKARELLSAATLSTLSRKKYFSGNRPQEATDFIGKARLGQTEEGSYIINVILPIDKPEIGLFETSSFTRNVATTLAKGLTAVENVVESIKNHKNINLIDNAIVDGAVVEGVSANLCDALIGLSGERKSRNFEISISLSKSEYQEPGLTFVHVFDASSIIYLEQTSEYLKENYVINNATISGRVKKLDRSPDKDVGTVTVTAFVGDRERNVSFDLNPQEYLEAIHAHENKQFVECSGDLYVSPRSSKLINCNGFKTIRNASIFDLDD